MIANVFVNSSCHVIYVVWTYYDCEFVVDHFDAFCANLKDRNEHQ